MKIFNKKNWTIIAYLFLAFPIFAENTMTEFIQNLFLESPTKVRFWSVTFDSDASLIYDSLKMQTAFCPIQIIYENKIVYEIVESDIYIINNENKKVTYYFAWYSEDDNELVEIISANGASIRNSKENNNLMKNSEYSSILLNTGELLQYYSELQKGIFERPPTALIMAGGLAGFLLYDMIQSNGEFNWPEIFVSGLTVTFTISGIINVIENNEAEKEMENIKEEINRIWGL